MTATRAAELGAGLLIRQAFEVPESEELPGAFVALSRADVVGEWLKSPVEPSCFRISSEPSTRSAPL